MDFQAEEKPLKVSVNNKATELKANRTYFYEMPTGNIEPVEAREAWELHKKKYKQIGSSDGTTYNKALKEAQGLLKTKGLEEAQERLRQGLQEELEQARGKIQTPPNYDIFGNGTNELKQRIKV